MSLYGLQNGGTSVIFTSKLSDLDRAFEHRDLLGFEVMQQYRAWRRLLISGEPSSHWSEYMARVKGKVLPIAAAEPSTIPPFCTRAEGTCGGTKPICWLPTILLPGAASLLAFREAITSMLDGNRVELYWDRPKEDWPLTLMRRLPADGQPGSWTSMTCSAWQPGGCCTRWLQGKVRSSRASCKDP